jgi:glycosyltransferase involved in cell wall biosynthesis
LTDADHQSPDLPVENREQSQEDLTIIIPVYKEAEELPATLERIDEAIAQSEVATVVLFVDDGSPDKSVEILLEHARTHPYLRVLALEGNHGQHTAVYAGIDHARSDVVATMEAHPEHEVGDLFELYAALDEGTDLVGGVRVGRTIPWWRRVGSWGLNRLLVGLGVSPFHDLGCQLAVWRRPVALEAFRVAAHLPWHRGLGHLLGALQNHPARNHPVQCRYTSDRPSAYHASALFKGAFLVLWTGLLLKLGLASPPPQFSQKPYTVASDSHGQAPVADASS